MTKKWDGERICTHDRGQVMKTSILETSISLWIRSGRRGLITQIELIFAKKWATLIIFNLSDIVPFVCIVVIVQGSLPYNLSDLQRISSFLPALCHQFFIPTQHSLCSHGQCCIPCGVAYVSCFFPVSYEGHIKQHVPSKNGCAWGGFEHCVMG